MFRLPANVAQQFVSKLTEREIRPLIRGAGRDPISYNVNKFAGSDYKQLLDSVFVISVIIKLEVISVISRSREAEG